MITGLKKQAVIITNVSKQIGGMILIIYRLSTYTGKIIVDLFY